MRRLLLTAALAVVLAPFAAHAEDAPAPAAAPHVFSDAEKAAIKDVVREYLTKEHPEIMLEGIKELQERDQASAEAKSKEAITTLKDKIYGNKETPVGGNPKGDVTIVEFYDYQCGYCKMSQAALEKLMGEDKNIRFIYKEFPVLGAVSLEAAKASQAASLQGIDKFTKFHNALMDKKEHLNEDIIYKAAKDVGLNVEKLKKDAASEDVAKYIQSTLDLGGQIGVRGTPLFIVGESVYPGALQYEQFKEAVAKARADAKAPAADGAKK